MKTLLPPLCCPCGFACSTAGASVTSAALCGAAHPDGTIRECCSSSLVGFGAQVWDQSSVQEHTWFVPVPARGAEPWGCVTPTPPAVSARSRDGT